MNFAWVIEHAESEGSQPRYFTGKRHPALQWSNPGDHADACRFARKEDAERIASCMGWYPPNPVHRICEHGWEDRPIIGQRSISEREEEAQAVVDVAISRLHELGFGLVGDGTPYGNSVWIDRLRVRALGEKKG